LKNIKSAHFVLFRDNTEKAWLMGIFEFCPQNRLRGPEIWGAKILLLPISPHIFDSGSRKFVGPWGFRRHTFFLNFKTLTLKTGRGELFKNSRFSTIGAYFKSGHRKKFYIEVRHVLLRVRMHVAFVWQSDSRHTIMLDGRRRQVFFSVGT